MIKAFAILYSLARNWRPCDDAGKIWATLLLCIFQRVVSTFCKFFILKHILFSSRVNSRNLARGNRKCLISILSLSEDNLRSNEESEVKQWIYKILHITFLLSNYFPTIIVVTENMKVLIFIEAALDANDTFGNLQKSPNNTHVHTWYMLISRQCVNSYNICKTLNKSLWETAK